MNKKYFFFDIDGTLTDRKSKKIVPSALKTLHLTNMVCNGGHGIVIDNQLIENAPLNFQYCLDIIHQCQQLGYGVLVAPDDNQEVYGKDMLFLKQAGFRKEPTTYFFVLDYQFEKFENMQVNNIYIIFNFMVS